MCDLFVMVFSFLVESQMRKTLNESIFTDVVVILNFFVNSIDYTSEWWQIFDTIEEDHETRPKLKHNEKCEKRSISSTVTEAVNWISLSTRKPGSSSANLELEKSNQSLLTFSQIRCCFLSMEAAFKGVDIDNSGYVEWDEFVFSLQGEEAQKYGLLADMEVTLSLLEGTNCLVFIDFSFWEISTDLKVMRGERTEGQKELFSLK